jgi:glycosyltransferase involved in cell wall biosynthesis
MRYTILITTYNRATYLRDTLAALAQLRVTTGDWEVIIVDNNSSDETRAVVEAAQPTFPVDLIYLFEATQGKPAALNTGIERSRGSVIAMTDDDVRVEPDWLDRTGAGFAAFDCDYVGGKVLPVWEAPRPSWLPETAGKHWAVIALLDYGPQPLEVGKAGTPWPLGANMSFRRDAFDRAGYWDNNFGRHGNTLRGQEQREWCLRARAAGLRGYYLPDAIVHHLIPKRRLNKAYFRSWFYWNGISRAILYQKLGVDMESPDESQLDFNRVPHLFGVPRYMFRTAVQHVAGVVRAAVQGRETACFEHELWLWFFAGVLRRRWSDRRLPVSASLASAHTS